MRSRHVASRLTLRTDNLRTLRELRSPNPHRLARGPRFGAIEFLRHLGERALVSCGW